jgi:hypothetical protein
MVEDTKTSHVKSKKLCRPLGKEASLQMRKISVARISNILLLTVATVGLWTLSVAESGNNGTYILDRTGEKWDVSQAESIGFKPENFQYGIGRYAFTTLDDSYLQSPTTLTPRKLRIIGVAADNQAQAYSVSKLSRHETANTTLNAKPILVGY